MTGSVTLQNNDADSLTLTANGAFHFPGPIRNNSYYRISILTQPSRQTCTLSSAVGMVAGANVNSVSVTCAANTYTVGGTVSGLTGTVVLQVNGGSNLSVSANGPFAFPTQMADGSPYSVTVLTQPAGQSCSIGNGTGTITAGNVADVSVSCAANTYTVGGTVSGLSGALVLQNNGANDLTIAVNGGFAFPGALANGSGYSVTVLTQPPGQTCSVANAAGTVSGANVANLSVTCTLRTFSVGGTVSGLDGSVVLQVNGAGNLSVSANGPFTFVPLVGEGRSYLVRVLTQPAGQTCTVANASGTVSGANVTNVSVVCATNTYTVGGTVTGLAGTVVLRVNGGDNLSVSANGAFAFAAQLASGSPYSVTVLTQPAGQSCSVANGSGTMPGADVTDVGVSCAANTYTVGGTVSGLSGTLVLQNNGANNLTVAANGGFAFPGALVNGSGYSVTVLTQPAGQTCTVANAAGALGGANVTNVSVSCAANTYTVGGTVSGLSGTLVLQNNGTNDLTIAANGGFAFSAALPTGTPYNVAVLTQPAGQTCTVANASSTVSGANVTNVGVVCAANAYTVGGMVSGLTGTVVLQVNGGGNLSVSADGAFAFGTQLADGSPYGVTVLTQPASQSCSIGSGTGTIAGANVTNVSVSCAANTYTVGGLVSGLSGTLVLQNNGANNLTIAANGGFAFPGALVNGSGYSVSVLTQPAGQTCSVANAAGALSGANVSNVSVSCAANRYTVGGTVSGLTGTLVLQNNGTNDLTIATNGGFGFSAALQTGSPYGVTVLTQPAGQSCSVANGAGAIAGANVTGIAVTCATNTYTVGGSVSGLTGTVVLQINGGGALSISTNGRFDFAELFVDGSTYNATVLTQPSGQTCTVVSATGAVSGASVTNIGVACAANSFSVGGTVSGLIGSVVLQLNGGSAVTVSASGAFSFAGPVANNAGYTVTVLTQPLGQTCTVANGGGTVSGANVTNVGVVCAANTYTLGGTVSGLTGTVVLQVNGGGNLSVSANGLFAFAGQLASGTPYSVTVLTQPAGQSCSVGGSTGTIVGASVTNVSVSCAANTYTVGGTVSGLSGTLVLQNNGGSNLTVAVNGGFAFPVALVNGSGYNVTVLTQPAGQTCSLANGGGTLSGADVTNVSVSCAANTYTVGGTVSGLAGTVVLQVNGGGNLSVSANGLFAFAGQLASGTPYSVTVLTQPAGQSCSIGGGTGTVVGANVTNVSVSCAANTYTVGGTVSGLSGTLVLQNNGGSNLTVAVNGGFAFPGALVNGNAYTVTVLTQPGGQTCTVANGGGTVSGANVTNVGVSCSNNPGTYATTFPATENAISEGGNWVNTVSATWNNPVSTGGGHAVGLTSTGFNDSIAMLTGSFSPDQKVTITAFRGAGDIGPAEIELLLRMAMVPGSPDQVFTYEIDIIPAQREIAIVRWNGPRGDFTLLSSGSIATINDGDVIEATISGPENAVSISVTLNGIPVVSATDTAGYATGNPGMGFDAGTPANGANFGIRSFNATSLGP